ncbi:MAG TPA: 4-(cytidine 5'-diphospho)-2-C-methyl-D-erythritol kinase, partial [Bacteroidales bacterium]|nr:4-(cytidine 5'-diphospho)-2-C-methyl-D-erythritol kinase [Bacteroidales bacterium]
SLAFENHDLISMVSELGSDCPFFIDNTPSFAQGRGELLNPVTPVLKGYYFVLLNPRISVNTKEAYQHCHSGQPSTSLSELVNKPVAEWKDIIKNDFEDYVFSKYPITGRIKEDLYRSGALFCLMSGSGSSVYGIFSKKPQLSDELKEMTIFEGIL